MAFNLINTLLPIFLIFLAILVGTILEKRHYRSIRERENFFKNLPTSNGKEYDQDYEIVKAEMVTSSVVVSVDYFKRFLAGLRKIVGGEVRSYISMLDRGRREAVLRLKEQCPHADIIVNLRIETSSVSKGFQKAIGCAEVLAYGTAVYYKKN